MTAVPFSASHECFRLDVRTSSARIARFPNATIDEDTAMSQPRENHETLENAAADAKAAAGRIGEGLDEVAGTARRFRDRLRVNGAVLQEELGDAGEQFVDGAKRLGDIASEQIRAHPLAAFGVAFAIGVVATRLLRR